MKNNKGFGLIEVLVAAGILSVMSLAMLKMFQSSFDSQAVLSSIMLDQDLKHAIRKSFEGVSCEKNMQSVSGDTITELKHYSSPTDTGMILIKKGQFKEKLDIVKMAIEQEPYDPIHKKLTVYYKRRGLGVLTTRDQKPCTETDLSGCYEDICKMAYKTGSIDDTCSLLNCSAIDKNSLAGISCDAGKYLTGFDSSGNKICKTSQVDQSCSVGEYLRGFDLNGNKICEVLLTSMQNQEDLNNLEDPIKPDPQKEEEQEKKKPTSNCNSGVYTNYQGQHEKIEYSYSIPMKCIGSFTGYDSYGDTPCNRKSDITIKGKILNYEKPYAESNFPGDTGANNCTSAQNKAYTIARTRCRGTGISYNQNTNTCTSNP